LSCFSVCIFRLTLTLLDQLKYKVLMVASVNSEYCRLIFCQKRNLLHCTTIFCKI
jgi:hypothetical protein